MEAPIISHPKPSLPKRTDSPSYVAEMRALLNSTKWANERQTSLKNGDDYEQTKSQAVEKDVVPQDSEAYEVNNDMEWRVTSVPLEGAVELINVGQQEENVSPKIQHDIDEGDALNTPGSYDRTPVKLHSIPSLQDMQHITSVPLQHSKLSPNLPLPKKRTNVPLKIPACFLSLEARDLPQSYDTSDDSKEAKPSRLDTCSIGEHANIPSSIQGRPQSGIFNNVTLAISTKELTHHSFKEERCSFDSLVDRPACIDSTKTLVTEKMRSMRLSEVEQPNRSFIEHSRQYSVTPFTKKSLQIPEQGEEICIGSDKRIRLQIGENGSDTILVCMSEESNSDTEKVFPFNSFEQLGDFVFQEHSSRSNLENTGFLFASAAELNELQDVAQFLQVNSQ
jgi:hypothetical protein